MIKQITTILGCALLGFGLACADNEREAQVCRAFLITSELTDSFTCAESTPCPDLPEGGQYATCKSIDTCEQVGDPSEISGKTITAYSCTGTPPTE